MRLQRISGQFQHFSFNFFCPCYLTAHQANKVQHKPLENSIKLLTAKEFKEDAKGPHSTTSKKTQKKWTRKEEKISTFGWFGGMMKVSYVLS